MRRGTMARCPKTTQLFARLQEVPVVAMVRRRPPPPLRNTILPSSTATALSTQFNMTSPTRSAYSSEYHNRETSSDLLHRFKTSWEDTPWPPLKNTSPPDGTAIWTGSMRLSPSPQAKAKQSTVINKTIRYNRQSAHTLRIFSTLSVTAMNHDS